MKKIALVLLSAATLTHANAQWLRPESVQGALWGGLLGGMIGADGCHGLSGEGAAIGAGIGLIAGTLAGEARRGYYDTAPADAYASAPQVSLGYGYGNCGSAAYVYYAPNAYTAPGYYYPATRPNYALGGTLLGAASGALIGSADGNAGEGAAIGAAAGLVLGSVAEYTTARAEKRAATTQSTAPATPTPNPPPADLHPGITSTPGATSTYYWTPRPLIADAPRVPDAPTF